MGKTAAARKGFRNINLVLQHTDRVYLDTDLSDILETLGLNEWRESWLYEEGVWQVTVTYSGGSDA